MGVAWNDDPPGSAPRIAANVASLQVMTGVLLEMLQEHIRDAETDVDQPRT